MILTWPFFFKAIPYILLTPLVLLFSNRFTRPVKIAIKPDNKSRRTCLFKVNTIFGSIGFSPYLRAIFLGTKPRADHEEVVLK